MQINEALALLGAHSDLLNSEEKWMLDESGFLVIPDCVPKSWIERVRRRLDLLQQLEGADAGKEVHQEAGTARLSNLVDKGDVFRICFTHPKVLAAVAHVLDGDLKLSSLNSRAALPGQGLQGFHADWSGPVPAGNYQVCNSIWLIDDFTSKNGATRAVPGSHRFGKLPSEVMPDSKADHPDQKLFIAPAGTVIVFNSHTWHGGTQNQTNEPRRALHSYYCRRNQPQQLDQRKYLSPATISSFPPEVRCVLDVM